MCMRSIYRLIFANIGAGALALASAAVPAEGAQRVRGMDRDGDGVITRSEWRGNEQSFRNHDWNRDGVLSGEEVRSAARDSNDDEDSGRGEGQFSNWTDWTEQRFADLDRDGDRRLSRQEWPANRELFTRVDRNNDQAISRSEFLGEYGVSESEQPSEISDRFERLDRNQDGVITMNEWPRAEWSFRRFDIDRDGMIERNELPAGRSQESGAYRSGYERGLSEGRTAGNQDRTRRNRWDLEGQEELERADSGYSPNMGSHEDYQAGYRAGFRVGYEDGFNRR
jgi:Ca2+-binding EF-hand superfamily protein